jgi:tRNA nucleotidyltransferase (CCA-adding enzyme)
LDALAADPAWQEAATERRRLLMLAVLCHDLGKPITTERVKKRGQLRWTSPGHAHAGLEPTRTLLERIGASPRLLPFIEPLVQYHLVHIDYGRAAPTDSQLRRLSRKLAPATLTDLLTVMRADSRGRPPREDPDTLRQLDVIAARAAELAVQDAAPQPLLQGRHLIARGLAPGPRFKVILDAAYEAQLAGEFDDEVTSLAWLDSHLKTAQT